MVLSPKNKGKIEEPSGGPHTRIVASHKSREFFTRKCVCAVARIRTHDLHPRALLPYHLTYTSDVIGWEMLSFWTNPWRVMASQNLESNQSLTSTDDGTGATPESFIGLIYWNPMLTPWLTACVWPVLRGDYHRSIILELVTSSMQIELICKIQCKLKMDGR